ncbi:AgaE protein [Escherichia coli]|uniref:AgaE protein n=1 Tax=Escherichia coli TaxID=562 RepID=A0A2X1JZ34_ECOLX|nr:AgaE protein [Escherichia coli]
MASNQTTLPNVSENEETLLTGVNENVYEDQSIGRGADEKRYQPRRLAFHAVTSVFLTTNVCRLLAGCTVCCLL